LLQLSPGASFLPHSKFLCYAKFSAALHSRL
jgi:hypothetical protein